MSDLGAARKFASWLRQFKMAWLKAGVLAFSVLICVVLFQNCQKFLSRDVGASQQIDPNAEISQYLSPTVIDDPQYILVNKDYTALNTAYRWHQDDPASVTLDSFNEIKSVVGTLGGENRKLGVSFYLSLSGPLRSAPMSKDAVNKQIAAFVQKITSVSEQTDIPISLTLSTNYFLSARADLWNWWDPAQPGYDPSNVQNVEWTCGTSQCATKASWMNWGSPFYEAPTPNLASPRYRAAVKEQLGIVLPILSQWYKNLPKNKKYLFAGVSGIAELSMGVNGYFCPSGNSYLTTNAPPGCASAYDGVQIGYAAAQSMGLGSVMNQGIIDAIHVDFVDFVHRQILDSGIPRYKVFAHMGNLASKDAKFFTSGKAAFSKYAQPGWSFYYQEGGVDADAHPLVAQIVPTIGHVSFGALEWNAGDATAVSAPTPVWELVALWC